MSMQEIVSLAVEIIDSQASALDPTRERHHCRPAGRYDRRAWALDVLTLLPDDRADAQAIVRAHCPGQSDADDPRRLDRLVKNYYRRLESTSLARHGERILHQLK